MAEKKTTKTTKRKEEAQAKPAVNRTIESGSVVVSARGKNIISSPQKLRLVADLIRGERVEKAQEILEYTNKRGAKELKKLLKSAVANAEHNFDLDPKSLVVSKLTVDEGIKMPRYRFASRGRVHKYVRRRSHVLIELSEEV